MNLPVLTAWGGHREGFTVDPFWGATAPPAISAFGAAIEEGGRDKLRAALGLAVQDLEGKELDEPALLEIGTPLFVGARAVLSAAVRANAQESDLVRDLGSLRIQEEHVQDILLVRFLSAPRFDASPRTNSRDTRQCREERKG